MSRPTVSVIIPAYNQADYLGQAIQSVLDQTYPHFELIVVNDASPDHTEQVVNQFSDPRLKYMIHKENRGLPATRNTGICASSGELITLLDQDDIFDPKKLETHVNFLEKNPNVGATYNARFEIDPDDHILSIWWPPEQVGHADFVLGFPFSPSDTTVRRTWIEQVNLFDEYYTFGGEDLDLTCRLALAGCQFSGIDRVLNYRRLYPNRTLRNPARGLDGALYALEKTFSDSRCSSQVLALKDKAVGKTYMIWSYEAFLKQETDLGQEWIREAIALDRSILDNQAGKFLDFLIHRSTRDDSDHEACLRLVFSQLPSELAWTTKQCEHAIAHGYLIKGARDVMWQRREAGTACLAKANDMGAQLNKSFLYSLGHQLLHYETAFGRQAAQDTLQALMDNLSKLNTSVSTAWLSGDYFINRAFKDYHQANYANVPGSVARAIFNKPEYLANKGVISMLVQSVFNLTQKA